MASITRPVEASRASEQRFPRDGVVPMAALEADVLSRLERHAAESGRLEGRVEALERTLRAERSARRRVLDRLKSERVAAERVHQRALAAEAGLASAQEQSERLREALAAAEQTVQMTSAKLKHIEQAEWLGRPAWRRLLRRPMRG